MGNTRKQLRFPFSTVILSVAIVGVLGFVFFNIRDLIFGTPLDIHTAKDGATLTDGFLPVSGNARHARNVLINGRSVMTDRAGNFTDGVLLSPGYNVLEVTLRDQFGKEKIKTYHLVLEPEESVAQTSTIHYQQ